MVTGRSKGLTLRGKGNVVLVAAQVDDADGNPSEQYVLLRADEFGRLRTIDAGAVATFLGLTDTPASYAGQGLQVVRVNAGETALEFAIATSHAPMFPQLDDLGATTWSRPGWAHLGTSSEGLVADRLYYMPIYVSRPRTFTQIGIHVTGAGAGGTVGRIGIYASEFDGGGDLTPGALVLDAGTVSVASSGQKSIAISELLTEGFYFLVVSSDGTPSLSRPRSDNPMWAPVTGRNTTINAGATTNFAVNIGDGAAALPDPATAPAILLDLNVGMVSIGE